MEFSVHTAASLARSRDQEANWTEPAQHGARRLAASLLRPTVNNELRGALRLTRSIPVAFASRNNEGSYDACGTHELCLAAPAILPQRVPAHIFKSRI
jgi:hypothetical protein